MPRLTHLSFDEITLQDASYRNALRDCKSLEVLATSWSNVNVIEALVARGDTQLLPPICDLWCSLLRIASWTGRKVREVALIIGSEQTSL
jgi:hypothetical protein